MITLAERYLTRAKDARRLAELSEDPIVARYLIELAESLEAAAMAEKGRQPANQP
jgi:hypothetical protein